MIRIFYVISLALFISCKNSEPSYRNPVNDDNSVSPFNLSSLSYEREGNCGDNQTHKLLQISGIIAYDEAEEKYIVHNYEIALHWEQRTYDFVHTQYDAPLDETSMPSITTGNGIIENASDLEAVLENLGVLTLDIYGQRIRPTLNVSQIPGITQKKFQGQIIRKQQTLIYPDC